MLHIAGEALLQIFLGDKELSDCEEGGDADDAHDVAYCVGMIDDDVSCDSKGENLEGVRRSEVDQHAYELKTDYDGQHVVQEVSRIVEITLYGKDLVNLMEEHIAHCTEGDNRDDNLDDLNHDVKSVVYFFNHFLHLNSIFRGYYTSKR